MDPISDKEQLRYAIITPVRDEAEYLPVSDLIRRPPVVVYADSTLRDAADQIREVLVHANYFSQKDVEICLAYDLKTLRGHASYPAIEALHLAFRKQYADEEEPAPIAKGAVEGAMP